MRKLNASEATIELGALPDWTLDHQVKSIRRDYVLAVRRQHV